MINPEKITNYNLNERDLQLNLIFWLLVAGKTAKVVSRQMRPLFNDLKKTWKGGSLPVLALDLIRLLDQQQQQNNKNWLSLLLKNNGIGCYKTKAAGLIQLSKANLNLRTCSINDLEKIKGIGRKTSRCFILHTRKNAQCSGLDTHILHCMKDLGYNVPSSSPSSNKKYLEIEQLFLNLVKKTDRTPAQLDLLIWRVYSAHKHLKPLLVKILMVYKNGQTQ